MATRGGSTLLQSQRDRGQYKSQDAKEDWSYEGTATDVTAMKSKVSMTHVLFGITSGRPW